MGWCHSANGDQTGAPLPEVTEQFETFGIARSGLWKCPYCATYYDYESDHDNGITDGWDSEYLTRVERPRALAILRSPTAEPRTEREIGALTRALEFDEALAGPLATRWVLDPEHAALVADLTARGVPPAETNAPSDFIWVRKTDGLEVYDHERLVLDAVGDRVTQADGRVLARADLARVIAFASDDHVHRGIKAVLSSGAEVDLVTDASLAAMSGIGYSRNDLLFDSGWCVTLGVALAKWAGVELDDQI